MSSAPRLRAFLVALSSVVVSLLAAAQATASFPGENGKIAFTGWYENLYTLSLRSTRPNLLTGGGTVYPPHANGAAWSPEGSRIAYTETTAWGSPWRWELFVMHTSGSGKIRLTETDVDETSPTWSPDGGEIAFVRRGYLEIMKANGRGARIVTEASGSPAWSPDGRTIAFERGSAIYRISPDGRNLRLLRDNAADPNWAPSGAKLAFENRNNAGISVMNADGSREVQLTSEGGDPAWSPDGTKIAFRSESWLPYPNIEFKVMNSDGSAPRSWVSLGQWGGDIDWQPLCTVKGTDRANVLRGTAARDVICAYGGKDRIYGRGGNDAIFAGAGDDTVYGGDGKDVVNGQGGRDVLHGEGGNDRLWTNDGATGDTVDGARGNDVCLADAHDTYVGCP